MSKARSEMEIGEDADFSTKKPFLSGDDSILDKEYEGTDSASQVFPLVITAADHVCVKLNQNIQSGRVLRDKIFY